jgi:hypothetical protein
MDQISTLSLGLLLVLTMVIGILTGLLFYSFKNRKQMYLSIQHLLDRLKVAETDLRRSYDHQKVLREFLRRKGILDDEDLAMLHRELIEIPSQKEAERNELLANRLDEENDGYLVKDIDDTIH